MIVSCIISWLSPAVLSCFPFGGLAYCFVHCSLYIVAVFPISRLAMSSRCCSVSNRFLNSRWNSIFFYLSDDEQVEDKGDDENRHTNICQ